MTLSPKSSESYRTGVMIKIGEHSLSSRNPEMEPMVVSEAIPHHIVKCRCQNKVFRIFGGDQSSWGVCVICQEKKILTSVYFIVCKNCGTIVAQDFPRGELRNCKCDDGDSRTILFTRDPEPGNAVTNPHFSTPADVPLTTRYGGGTYEDSRQNRPSVSNERTRFPSAVKEKLFEKCGGVCGGCLDVFKQVGNMEIDHIVPVQRGGSNDFGNLQLLCRSCNTQKGTGTMDDLILKLKEKGIR